MEKEYDKSGRYPKEDLVGHTFGRLTLLSWEGRNYQGTNMWLCQCQCDNQKVTAQGSLKSGATKSCGCLIPEANTTHGYAKRGKEKHPLYNILAHMKSRCYSETNRGYKDYGGRGIKICDEWVNSPETFMDWGFKHGYEEGLSIERIDNDGNYTPENCCFIELRDQANNRRSSHLLTYNGKTQNMALWAKEFGLKYHTLKERIRRGWTVEDALLRPLNPTKLQKNLKQRQEIQ